jgi:hypothetical protein
MKRIPRRHRAHLKAWAYLALFGTDDDTDEAEDESSSDTSRNGDTDNGDSPGEN